MSVNNKSAIEIFCDEVYAHCEAFDKIFIPKSVNYIDDQAIEYCHDLTHVYYGGSEEDKANITIASSSISLSPVKFMYHSPIGSAQSAAAAIPIERKGPNANCELPLAYFIVP